MTTEQIAHHCEELTRRVERGLKVRYPRRSVFRWKNRVKAWYDLPTATFLASWSSRFAVVPKGMKVPTPTEQRKSSFVEYVSGDDSVTVVPFQSFGGYAEEEHIPDLIAWVNTEALKGPPTAEGQARPLIGGVVDVTGRNRVR